MWAVTFTHPYTEGAPVTELSNVYDCAFNGRPFRMDRKHEAFRQGFRSLALLRDQADNSAVPGEASINREDLWRRSQSSWHHGAGQRHHDKEDSDPERFWESKGIDPWTKDQISLLHDTELVEPSGSADLHLLSVSQYVYMSAGTDVYRTANPEGSWTSIPFPSVTGAVTSLATNGYDVWATTPSGTWQTNRNTSTWSSWLSAPASGDYYLVGSARGRTLVANEQHICEVTAGPTVTELNPSSGNTDFRWTAIAEGQNTIYAAGYSGDRSQIFRISPPADDPGADLGVPVAAAPSLPTGEVVRSLYGYLGVICIGTDKGVRTATADSEGNLTIGPLIATPAAVNAFDGADRFVWFGYSNYDSTSTGLGRLDLSQQVDVGLYAHASDLMATAQGSVTSIITWQDKRYFAVAGSGIYAEGDTYVDSGSLLTGRIKFGLIDTKVAVRAELRHASLVGGSVEMGLGADDGAISTLGTSDLVGSVEPTITFNAGQASGTFFELQLVLYSSDEGSPVVQHSELRAYPAPPRALSFLVPLLLTEADREYPSRKPLEDLDFITSLISYTHSATYQEKSKTMSVVVEDYEFERSSTTKDNTWWNGTLVVKCKTTSPY